MPLMGSFYVGTSGLQTSSNALNTTAHNITNSGTKGYTRQVVHQSTKVYSTIQKNSQIISWQQYGLGVNYARTRQIRDVFLDKKYREEAGRADFYKVCMESLNEVQDILGEMSGADFADSLSELWVAIQELSKDPSSATTQSLFVTRASQFMEHADGVYSALATYQDELNNDVSGIVTQINYLGDQIFELNNAILKVEAGDVERANDLRDQRNLYIDQLAELANIQVDYTVEGIARIRIEQYEFVTPDFVDHMATLQDEVTDFVTPYWPRLANTKADGSVDISEAKVFNLTREISTAKSTDVGKLKGILLARGDHRATFQDLPREPKAVMDKDGNPTGEYEYVARVERLNFAGEPTGIYDFVKTVFPSESSAYFAYDQDVDFYNKNISQSICMNIMAEFDRLVNEVVTSVNDTIEKAANAINEKLDANGAHLYPDANYICDENGEVYKIFELVTPDGGWTTANVQINKELLRNPGMLGFMDPEENADYINVGEELKTIFTAETHVLNPNVATKNNILSYYTALVSQVAIAGAAYRENYDYQQETVNTIEEARQSVSGVSDDEELQNMIMFQNAYNASSRYINVINDMLETLLTRVGRV